jgi:hypothetical protein
MRILPKCQASEDGKHSFAEIRPKYLRKRIGEYWEQCQNKTKDKECYFLVNRKRYERVKKIRVNKN